MNNIIELVLGVAEVVSGFLIIYLINQLLKKVSKDEFDEFKSEVHIEIKDIKQTYTNHVERIKESMASMDKNIGILIDRDKR